MKDNKLIAEFMGWDILSPTTIPPNLHLSNLEVNNGEIPNFKFHSSWDWLMPVAEKCLCTDEKTDGQHYFINDALLSCNIEVVFDRVIEFIKDYNKSI